MGSGQLLPEQPEHLAGLAADEPLAELAITEHSAGQHVAQAPDLAATTFVAASTDTSSFSWRDAGVGAAGVVAVLLLLLAAALALYRRGRPAATHG